MGRGVHFRGSFWTSASVDTVLQGLNRVFNAFVHQFGVSNVEAKLNSALGLSKGLTFQLILIPDLGYSDESTNIVTLNLSQFNGVEDKLYQMSKESLIEGVIHELGHVVDANYLGRSRLYSETSPTWANRTHWVHCAKGSAGCSDSGWQLLDKTGLASDYAGSVRPAEDFAETFVWWVSNVNNGWKGSTSVRTNGKPSQERRDMLDGVLGV